MKLVPFFCFATLVVAENLPEFIRNEMKLYDNNPDSRMAFSQPIGWGTGTYRPTSGVPMRLLWFAYSNSDGWLQFKFNNQIGVPDLVVLRNTTDKHSRRWKAEHVGGGTWIGTTNDWINRENGYCYLVKSNTVCLYKNVLDSMVVNINKQPFLKLIVSGYLE